MTALEEYGQVFSRVHRGGADRGLREEAFANKARSYNRFVRIAHLVTSTLVRCGIFESAQNLSTYLRAKIEECGKEIFGDDGDDGWFLDVGCRIGDDGDDGSGTRFGYKQIRPPLRRWGGNRNQEAARGFQKVLCHLDGLDLDHAAL
jgi:hypothetical protein